VHGHIFISIERTQTRRRDAIERAFDHAISLGEKIREAAKHEAISRHGRANQGMGARTAPRHGAAMKIGAVGEVQPLHRPPSKRS
jgi:hypothetical protein